MRGDDHHRFARMTSPLVHPLLNRYADNAMPEAAQVSPS
jgi:hypothetical protein